MVEIPNEENINNMRCPSLLDIFDYLSANASPAEREILQQHFSSGCQTCLENRRWLQDIKILIRNDASISYTEGEIQRVVSLFPSERQTSSIPFRRILTQLLFDSMSPNQHAYVRLESAPVDIGSGRQYMYHAEGYDIDLMVQNAGGGQEENLVGQLLPAQKRSTSQPLPIASLSRGGVEIDRIGLDTRGRFKFISLAHGQYDLTIQIPEGEILIRGLKT